MQKEISPANDYEGLKDFMQSQEATRPLLVCGSSFSKLPIVRSINIEYRKFSGFTPNPLYEQCMEGKDFFVDNKCDMILAVGGGSAIDVAKCIRHYSGAKVPFVAIPTTAGTGSESTRFAVIYKDGEKLSVESELCYPDAYVLDSTLLAALPYDQRVATMLDALSHGIESFWSVNSTKESSYYSEQAIRLVLEHKDGYLSGRADGEKGMLKAANTAGKAINITKTTAGHAMCYKLTSIYGFPHGKAAALCIKGLLPIMADNLTKCKDERGMSFLNDRLNSLAGIFGCSEFSELVEYYRDFIDALLPDHIVPQNGDMDILVCSVNEQRLANHPIEITMENIRKVYEYVFDRFH